MFPSRRAGLLYCDDFDKETVESVRSGFPSRRAGLLYCDRLQAAGLNYLADSFHPDERDCCIVTYIDIWLGMMEEGMKNGFHPDERDCCIVTWVISAFGLECPQFSFHPDERDCCIVTRLLHEIGRLPDLAFPSRRAGLLYCDPKLVLSRRCSIQVSIPTSGIVVL